VDTASSTEAKTLNRNGTFGGASAHVIDGYDA